MADPEIAPLRRLRVALIGANPVLVTRAPDGTVGGVSVDLGKFIAERLGLSFDPVVYPDPEAYARSFGRGEWDIALGPRNREAAQKSHFSPDFMLVDNLFVAAPGREFADAGQVDQPGVKIAVARNGSPDRFLTWTLKFAELVRVSGGLDIAIEVLRNQRADAYGSNAHFIHALADGLAGAKIVPGVLITVRMAVALPKGRSLAAQGKLAEIINEAKATGVVLRAIEKGGLRGVRVAPN